MNKIYLMDCMEYMKDLPDNAFELAIVDPPYGIGDFNSSKSKHSKITWNENIPDERYFAELNRVSKNQIIWGANYYGIKGGRIIHDKLGSATQVQSATLSDADIAYQSFNNLIKIFRYTWKGNIHGNKVVWGEKKIHPCEKPIALYKWLLKNYAKPGDKILDTHIGSGSIRIACHDMGFDLTGCELDKDYFDAQEARFQNHISQADLFGADEMQNLIFKDKA